MHRATGRSLMLIRASHKSDLRITIRRLSKHYRIVKLCLLTRPALATPIARSRRSGTIWQPTVPPIDLDAWPVLPPQPDAPLTTIVRWRGVHDVKHNGAEYGQRDKEFPKFFGLPRATGASFRVALIGEGRASLEQHGWQVVDGGHATQDLESYRTFIAESRAEIGIAKQCYVNTRGGWFSDRSASYLAAGRPVVVQDTGIGDWLPVGRGVLTFRSFEEAMAAVAELEANFEVHASCCAADS